ncbi:MAG TPA: nitrate- and nitrite sensing domain-containing protein [Streptosporangiaceae bacterium]|nr:nitrate- and nitrite sensing domain-containing protein [Streptosporangiaceae bacterium]
MSLRRRSVLLRVALLVLVPLVFLVGLFSYTVTTSVNGALTLIRSKVMMDDLGQPVASLQQALTRERAQTTVYYARPTAAVLAALQRQQTITDHAVASVTAATDSSSVRQSASAGGKKAIAALNRGLASLAGLRANITDTSISAQGAFAAYSGMIGASYQVLEQAIREEGDSTQVLPGIAVIELAVSNEYLEQESALLDGNFAAHAFPASDHLAFVRLVGAHRLLYAQSYSYLDQADRTGLNHDVNPQTARTVAALEDRLVASDSPNRAPPVRPVTWNRTVATLGTQTQQAVGEAEARLASGARSQANAKLHRLYLAGGLGLAAVVASLVLSLCIAVNLARQLHGLRDSALDMANIRLPDVVRRLRAGEDVDVAGQVPQLEARVDEIGQVKAAFNTAQRTAVEAAVDEARVRRGVNDVFRNLARRSQSLLERQMALLDALERRAAEPDDLEGLFRIDHLTTRMRRHAESLIVLAGDSPKRAFHDPVPFVDVLRAAAAEVEDYTRIKVISRTPAALAGPAVADVIHMLAEFVENAAIFSPSNTEVRITGDLVANGFAVDIEDRGQGMSDEEIAAVNTSLAHPPLFDLSGSDQLGLFVAAKLARRHSIRVTLRHSAYGGITAIVLIPRDLVVAADAIGHGVVPGRSPGGRMPKAARNAVAAQPVTGAQPAPVLWDPPAAGSADLPRSHPLPETDPTGPFSGNGAAEPAAFAVATAPSDPEPVDSSPGQTENGLPQRVRLKNLAPQLRGTTATPSPAGEAASSRSPETARSVMASFRRGWQRGLSDPDVKQDHGTDLQGGESQ